MSDDDWNEGADASNGVSGALSLRRGNGACAALPSLVVCVHACACLWSPRGAASTLSPPIFCLCACREDPPSRMAAALALQVSAGPARSCGGGGGGYTVWGGKGGGGIHCWLLPPLPVLASVPTIVQVAALVVEVALEARKARHLEVTRRGRAGPGRGEATLVEAGARVVLVVEETLRMVRRVGGGGVGLEEGALVGRETMRREEEEEEGVGLVAVGGVEGEALVAGEMMGMRREEEEVGVGLEEGGGGVEEEGALVERETMGMRREEVVGLEGGGGVGLEGGALVGREMMGMRREEVVGVGLVAGGGVEEEGALVEGETMGTRREEVVGVGLVAGGGVEGIMKMENRVSEAFC